MEPRNSDLTLDGNAAGGLLAEAFGEDLTGVVGTCPDRHNKVEIGSLVAFTHAPGVVLRCRACDGVQMVIVRTPYGLRREVRVRVGKAV